MAWKIRSVSGRIPGCAGERRIGDGRPGPSDSAGVTSASEWVRRVFPIADWLPGYGTGELRGDLRAGVTVAVMLIPQGMAYAVLAGVPPIYGLYASLVPLLVYPLFGSSRQLAVGVNAAVMVVVAGGLAPYATEGSVEYVGLAVVVTALSGLLMLAMSAARMGFVANLLSRPVILGFTTAAALIILASEMGHFLGLDLGRTQFVPELLLRAGRRTGEWSWTSIALGGGCLGALIGLRRWKELFPGELVVLAAATVAAWALDLGEAGVQLVGKVPSGLPGMALPEVGLGTVRELWAPVLALTLVQYMSAMSIGRLFSSRHRYTVDANQELTAIGASNFLGSLFRAIPVSGSFSRSAVNEQVGARTPAANWVTAAVIGLTLLFLTPLFTYLPFPALAAIITMAAVGLIDIEEILRLFRMKPSDGWVAAVTFLAVLTAGITDGVLIGVTFQVIKILYRISRPYVAELGHLPATRSFKNVERFSEARPIEGLLILRVEAGFSFFNARFFRDFVLQNSQAGRRIRAVIIDGLSINYLDSTAVESIEEVVGTLREWGIDIHFTGLTGPVRDVVERSGLGDLVGEDHFHISPHYAVIDILDRWDDHDGGNRLEHYWRSTQRARREVEPTSEERFL